MAHALDARLPRMLPRGVPPCGGRRAWRGEDGREASAKPSGDQGTPRTQPAAFYLVNRSSNRPSHEGAAALLDRAAGLCRSAGFRRITFRGDTDFTQTKHLDDWDSRRIRFVLGCAAQANLIERADALQGKDWTRLVRREEYEVRTELRRRPDDVKDVKVIEHDFTNLRLRSEDVAEFTYTPVACKKAYRMVVVRKNITVEKGACRLFDEVRYFFYITNDRKTPAEEIVFLANGCTMRTSGPTSGPRSGQKRVQDGRR